MERQTSLGCTLSACPIWRCFSGIRFPPGQRRWSMWRIFRWSHGRYLVLSQLVKYLGGRVWEGGSAKNSPACQPESSGKRAHYPLVFWGLDFGPFGAFVNLSMNLPGTSTLPTTGKRAAERKKAEPPAWKIRRKPRFISYRALFLPSNGKGIYGKSLWILCPKKPANPHEYWQKWGGHLKCPPQMVAEAGFEPTTFGLWARRATELLHSAISTQSRLLYYYTIFYGICQALFQFRKNAPFTFILPANAVQTCPDGVY